LAARYARTVVEVAPAHLDRPFDYLVPDGWEVGFGQRVRVDFAGRRVTGWVVGVGDTTDTDPARIRPLHQLQGDHAWFDPDDLRLYRWVADRYAATLADVLRHAMPDRVAHVERSYTGGLSTEAVFAQVSGHRVDKPPVSWAHYGAQGLLDAVAGGGGAFWVRPLVGDDAVALLLDLISRCLDSGRSALVLSPDPSSALAQAVLELADGVDLRQDKPRERYEAYLRCRFGGARVAVGERGGVFAPLRDLGLVLVEDEANPSYKERRAPRHNAREVALARARMQGAACVLTGDLPSAQLWRMVAPGHVAPVVPNRADEREQAPRVTVVDLEQPRAKRTRFTDQANRTLSDTVRRGGAAVVLAARGGQGAALACRRCGARRACPACDSSLRSAADGWQCATCGWTGDPFTCAECHAEETAPLAAGAGRLAQELARSHRGAEVMRMEGFDAPGPDGRPAIAVMTRGSVVTRPGWLHGQHADVVVLPDADALLNRPGLEAAEDALRLWMAVARWAPHVVVQTRQPRDPAVQALVRWDPEGFWRNEAERRALLGFPPARSLVALKVAEEEAPGVADELRRSLPGEDEVLGPDPGGGLLVKSAGLRGTLDALTALRQAWSKAGMRVRVDVDPTPIS
jgi:primosomal protein N' (replication factor Y) (superfamily II helicase)